MKHIVHSSYDKIVVLSRLIRFKWTFLDYFSDLDETLIIKLNKLAHYKEY